MLLVTAIVVGALAWLACGALAYALTFAYFQGKYPSLATKDYRGDRIFSLIYAITGPIGLLIALVCGGTKYGLKWR